MNRRELLKWIPPVVMAVTLPVHAQTSVFQEKPEEEKPQDGSDEPQNESSCKEGKTLICHREPKKQDISICVADSSVPAHVRNHGDTIGGCG